MKKVKKVWCKHTPVEAWEWEGMQSQYVELKEIGVECRLTQEDEDNPRPYFTSLIVRTSCGESVASLGDFIVRDSVGLCHVYKSDNFELLFETVGYD